MKALKITIALLSIISTLTAQDQPVTNARPSKVKEFGIGLSSFNNFSLQYRWGNENRLYRVAGNLGANTSLGNNTDNSTTTLDTVTKTSTNMTTKTSTPINLTCGLSFSAFKIKFIADKFGIIYGGITGISYAINTTKTTATGSTTGSGGSIQYNNNVTDKNTQTLTPYIGIMVGAVYKINSSFLLYGEISPNINYSYNMTTTDTKNVATFSNSSSVQTTNQNNKNGTNNIAISQLSNSGSSLTIVYRITK